MAEFKVIKFGANKRKSTIFYSMANKHPPLKSPLKHFEKILEDGFYHLGISILSAICLSKMLKNQIEHLLEIYH